MRWFPLVVYQQSNVCIMSAPSHQILLAANGAKHASVPLWLWTSVVPPIPSWSLHRIEYDRRPRPAHKIFPLFFFTSWEICLQHFWCNTLVSISSTGVVNVQAIKNKAELKVGRDGLGPLTTSYPINPCGLSIEYSSTPNVFYLVFVCKLLLFFFLPLTKWILEREMEVEVGLTTSWDINHIWPLPIIVG